MPSAIFSSIASSPLNHQKLEDSALRVAQDPSPPAVARALSASGAVVLFLSAASTTTLNSSLAVVPPTRFAENSAGISAAHSPAAVYSVFGRPVSSLPHETRALR